MNLDMFGTKTAKLGALVVLFAIFAGVQPEMASQYSDMRPADLLMLGLGLIFGRDMVQKLIVK